MNHSAETKALACEVEERNLREEVRPRPRLRTRAVLLGPIDARFWYLPHFYLVDMLNGVIEFL